MKKIELYVLALIFVGIALLFIACGGGGDGTVKYTITGSIYGSVVESITITLSGDASDTTSSNASGDFSFSGLTNGSYTLTPSLTNYTFSPSSINITISGRDSSGSSFTSIGVLSGTVSGDTAAGVTIDLSGAATDSTTTDGGGNYSFNGLGNGAYIITPSAAGYAFTPVSTVVNFTGVASTANDFSAAQAATTYSISGAVSGDIVANVPVTLSLTAGGDIGNTLTDSNGDYIFAGLVDGLDYTVTPSRTDYTFTPNHIDIASLAADSTGNDFTDVSDVAGLERHNVSGTVFYGASQGDIYILLEYQGGYMSIYGTSINTPGAYTIRGVPDAPFRAIALMDALDIGYPNASDPVGVSTDFVVSGSDVSGVDITLIDPALPTPVAPSVILAFPADQGAGVIWEAPTDSSDFEIADAYDLYWNTSSTVGPANNIGSVTDIAPIGGDMGHYFLDGLTNNDVLYFGVRAKVGGSNSSVTVSGPVTIGAPTGGSTVSGSVTLPGATTNPLLLVLYSFSEPIPVLYTTRVTSPSSPQPFSMSGVVDGDYHMIAFIDMNNSNVIDLGDWQGSTEDSKIPITVNGADVVRNLTLNDDNSIVRVTTEHDIEGVDEGYSVQPKLFQGVKRAIKVTITGGPSINTPVDLNPHEGVGQFESDFGYVPKPAVGDLYTYEVTYSDDSNETLSGSVNAVLESFPTPISPIGAVTGQTHPTFTWSAPTSPPPLYFYKINVYSTSDTMWDSPELSSSATSVEYNFDGEASQDPLNTGNNYWWHLNVIDQNDNRAWVRTQFTP